MIGEFKYLVSVYFIHNERIQKDKNSHKRNVRNSKTMDNGSEGKNLAENIFDKDLSNYWFYSSMNTG